MHLQLFEDRSDAACRVVIKTVGLMGGRYAGQGMGGVARGAGASSRCEDGLRPHAFFPSQWPFFHYLCGMQGSPSFRLPLEVCRLPAVDSTNGWVLARLETLPSVCLVIADRQLHGRGQRGNGWLALEGDLACTLLVKEPPVRPAAQFRLLQMASVAVVDALRQLGIPASIKWPNDILVGRQKICGILLETGIRGAKLAYAAIGIGLNLAPRTPRDSAFPRPATTAAQVLMRAHSGTTAKIEESRTLRPIATPPSALGLGVSIASQIVALIANHQWGLPPSVNYLYHAQLSGVESPLRYRDAQGEFSARVVAALPDGRLLLAKADGSTQAYAFQEIRTLE